MNITLELLNQEIENLTIERNKTIAQVNMISGAIQACEQLKAKLAEIKKDEQ